VAGTRSRLVRAAPNASTTPSLLAFEDFYREQYAAVVGLAYVLVGNRWTAEDLVQEAFLAAHRQWERVATLDQPGAWIRRVVANMAVSTFRRRITEARALARFAHTEPSTIGELNLEAAEFWRAVRSLPRRQSQVVALFYLEDLPISDIADVLNMAHGTVKKHLHDGRRGLASRLRVSGVDQ
jgi:RNA polymerase sigma-70 factor (ECF subfamily)